MTGYLTDRELEMLSLPTESARGLPNRTYTDPACFDLELRTVFRSNWVGVEFVHRIATPGTVVPLTVGGAPVVLVTGSDGVVRAFHNTNPYDACALTTERVVVDRLRGAYHGFVWDLEGHLTAMPYFDGTEAAVLPDDGRFDLVPVACGTWLDLVLVCVDPPTVTVDDHVDPAVDQLADLDLSTLRPAIGPEGAPLVSINDVPGNWKIAFENDVDVYHEAFVHEYYANSPDSPKVDPSGTPTYQDIDDRGLHGLAVPAELYDDEGDEALPPIPIADGSSHRAIICDLYPNIQLGVMRDHYTLGYHLPADVAITINHVAYYVDESIAADAEVSQLIAAVWDETRHEDDVVVAATQLGRSSPGLGQPRYSPFWDRSLHSFHRRVAADVLAAGGSDAR